MSRLHVGVIGCGVMGSFHIKQYRTISDIELVGVSDADPSRKVDGVEFYTDYKELLKKVDAVSIVTPTFTHFVVANDALDAGVNVLIEKPIAINAEQAEKLIQKAKSKKLTLSVGHIERFNPAYSGLRSALNGKKPDIIDIRRLAPLPQRIGDVSVIIDMMIHDIDLAIKLADSEVKYVHAIGSKVMTDKLDKVFAVIVFKNGIVANIEASRVHADKVRSIVAATNEMICEADLLTKKLIVRKKGKPEEIKLAPLDSLNAELKDFIAAIQKNTAPLVTGKDAKDALIVAQTIEELCLKAT